MSLRPVLIDGEWRQAAAPSGVFSAEDPSTKQKLPCEYPISSDKDVAAATAAARTAVLELRATASELRVSRIADFLERFATEIEGAADALVELARKETGLPAKPRLSVVELPRTTDQLRQAARAVRERSWVEAVLDTRANIRSMYGPLDGAVVLFGPNNFPLAFNAVSGGDFASAVAAGNPVIAKAHPSQPGTSECLAEAARKAVVDSGLPRAMVQMLYGLEPELGYRLVRDPAVAAVGFTGGRASGLALKQVADQAGKPAYVELSSVNPVFILPGALDERGQEIAAELAMSCLLGVGQFCTNPGLCVVPAGSGAEGFVERVKHGFEAGAAGTLLNSGVASALPKSVARLRAAGARLVTGGSELVTEGYAYANTLLTVSGDDFLKQAEALQQEAFGPVNLTVVASDARQMVAIAEALEGNLTGSIYSHSGVADDEAYEPLALALRSRVGRLLNDKMPTGVAVSAAMVHGGPYPSTGHPGFTSVGIPASIRRFAARFCYDGVRARRLPPELQDENPVGLWRCVDGAWTTASLSASRD